MRIHELELHEVCQHRNRRFSFSPGVNGIVGPNGFGKSNVLKMLKANLTGDFTSNAGNKDENISFLAPPSAPSYIVGTWTHGETRMEIVRGLRGRKTQVTIDGGAPIIGDVKVNAATFEVLGVEPVLITDYVFVDQGSLFDFIDQTPAVRANAFQPLFGTKKASVLHKQIGDWLGTIEGVELGRDPKLIEEQREAVYAQRVETALNLRRLTPYATYDPTKDPNQEVIKTHDDRERILKSIEAKTKRVGDLRSQIQKSKPQVIKLRESVQGMDAVLADTKKDVDAARTQLAQWDSFQAHLERLKRAQASVDKERAELQKWLDAGEPQAPDDFIVTDVGHDELARLTNQISLRQHLREFVKDFKRPAKPTGLAKAIYDMVDEADAQIDEIEGQILALRKRIARSKEFLLQEQDYNSKVAWNQKALKLAEAQLAAEEASNTAAAEYDVEELETAVDEFDKLTLELPKARKQLADAERSFTTLESQFQSEETALEQLNEDLPGEVTTAEYDKAVIAIQESTARRSEYAAAKALHDRLGLELKDLAEEKKAAEAARTKASRIEEFRKIMETVRHAFHFSQLPRVVANNYLEALSEDINDLLSLFEIDFRVVSDADLTFTAKFLDGREQPAARLSGGQKVVLAMAFRIAVNSMFAKNIGLLCLDEPTQYLDKQNLLCLETALGKLKELSTSRGLQCLLITHEDALAKTFDSVTSLG